MRHFSELCELPRGYSDDFVRHFLIDGPGKVHDSADVCIVDAMFVLLRMLAFYAETFRVVSWAHMQHVYEESLVDGSTLHIALPNGSYTEWECGQHGGSIKAMNETVIAPILCLCMIG